MPPRTLKEALKLRIPVKEAQELSKYGFDVTNPKPIAAGVNGVVFEGKCNELAKKRVILDDQTDAQEIPLTGLCAIKMCDNELWKGQLYEEAKMLVDLRHPNLVEVYLIMKVILSKTEARRYFVLEYINAGTLKDRLKPLSPEVTEFEALHMFRQLSTGLQFLHKKDITHNDLHSGNIMINRDHMNNFEYKIVDFGSCKSLTKPSEKWFVRMDIQNLGNHFVRVLEKSPFQRNNIKQTLRKLFEDMESGRIESMDKVVEVVNQFEIIGEPPPRIPSPPPKKSFSSKIRALFPKGESD